MALFDNRSADRRADGEQAEQPPASRYGLLLVDDETLNLTALAALLGEDYRVYTATHGNEALALLVDPAVGSGIQMVVSDQRMPGMTGVQLLTRIRALRPDIKALLLTGYDDVNAVVSAINDASVYRYMQKPVDIQELRLALLRASEAWQLEQDNKNLVAALSQSYEQLALLDEAKTSFLRYLAHEVNTPLNWLAATTVIDRMTLGTETALMLKYVDQGRERLYGLVSAVLRYFEGAGLDLRVHPQPVDITALLADKVALLRRQHIGGLGLHLEQPPRLSVETDPELLVEILDHLLENAVAHALRSGDMPAVVVRAAATADGVTIEVHNGGRVPDASTIEQLFQPFFFCGSLHGLNGYGLSLATARALALTLGGSLEADTATVTSGGLCLRLQLPIRLLTEGESAAAGATQTALTENS